MWDEWYTKFISALDKCAPVKTRRAKKKGCPWMTSDLLHLIHERKRLYKRLEVCQFVDSDLFVKYRKIRNAATNLYRRTKNQYFQECCWTYKENPGRLWSTIRRVTGREQSKSTPNVPVCTLNDYFASLVSSTEPPCIEVPYGPPAEVAMDTFEPVSAECVRTLLANLDATKSYGPDGIHPWVLKVAADSLASSVTNLFN